MTVGFGSLALLDYPLIKNKRQNRSNAVLLSMARSPKLCAFYATLGQFSDLRNIFGEVGLARFCLKYHTGIPRFTMLMWGHIKSKNHVNLGSLV